MDSQSSSDVLSRQPERKGVGGISSSEGSQAASDTPSCNRQLPTSPNDVTEPSQGEIDICTAIHQPGSELRREDPQDRHSEPALLNPLPQPWRTAVHRWASGLTQADRDAIDLLTLLVQENSNHSDLERGEGQLQEMETGARRMEYRIASVNLVLSVLGLVMMLMMGGGKLYQMIKSPTSD
ncbi:hypothetical protein M407DRAFT_190374 [Tulasnella calospora MUT 4182]|uniref:Uncharacterized protein n=1 Tax=Tulasnella calospora MUT 4182 TaxID=1051891 RepID=A0A0C3M1H6_9AGAM|nr:hypothetical protein M407DRAFT_190374 [Tulasnella calospora MUT 4182]